MRNLPKLKSLFAAFALTLICGISAFAQQGMVRGTIKEASGEPIVGASVIIEGTSTGVSSATDGSFAINASSNAVFEVSCIGFKTQLVPVAGRSNIDITLEEDNEFLEETVVIGYSVQKKSNVTGAIAAVKSQDMENRSSENAGSALQGKLAGLQVFTRSGAPGASTSFRIRGYSSTSGSSDPLYLVDGLKVNNIDYLDTESIESIEILKDAASAAIYGAEAGNGVVLITTKTGGANGTSKIFYNGQYAVTSQARKLEMMNASEFKDYWTRAGKVTNDEVFGKADTDWQEEMLENGIMQRHTVGIQGADARSNYFVSLTYQDQDGIIKGENDVNQRFVGQVNGTYKIRPWLTVGTTNTIERGYTKSISEQQQHAGATQSIFHYDPTVPVAYTNRADAPSYLLTAEETGAHVFYDKNGNLYGISQLMTSFMYNPDIMLEYIDNKSWRTNVNGTAYADFKPIKELVFTSKLGYRISNTYSNNYTSPYYLTAKQQNASPSLTSRSNNSIYYQWENYLNFNKSFGKHDLAVMAGMQYADTRTESVSGTTNELSSLSENFHFLDYTVAAATTRTLGGSYYNRRNISYFGRIGYTYAEKYMIQANFRADAFDASKLSRKARWGYFPSISAGWTVSNEPWFKDNISSSSISFLKLRASWGINGNVNSLNGFPYTSAMVLSQSGTNGYYARMAKMGYNYDNTGLHMGALPSSTLPNPDLSWEESRQVDAGLDARFFNNRLSLAYDFFKKRTTGMLGTISAPFVSGCSTQTVNAGIIDNWGHEFELSWKDQVSKDFSYEIDANLSTVRNNVVESPYEDGRYYVKADGGYSTCIEAGYPMWYLRTYKVDHIDASTGAPIYTEGDKDGSYADGKEFITSGIPDFTYGLTFNAKYKDFDIVIFGNGVQGVYKFLNIYDRAEPMINMPKFVYDQTWKPGMTDAKFCVPSSTETKFSESDMWVFDASYFRIKQIQIGYSLPKNVISKVAMQGLRVYVSLDDFFTFTKYPGDPESRSNLGSLMTIDNIAYPQTKRLIFGLNLTF